MINNREKGATSDFDDFQICYRVQHFVHFSYSHNWQSFLVFELKSPIITKKESLDNCVVVIPPPTGNRFPSTQHEPRRPATVD